MKSRSRMDGREGAARITILAMGSRGDVQPYLALALGLKDVGYDVVFVAYTNFAEEVEAQGLEYRPVLGDYQEIVSGELGAKLLEQEPARRRIKMEETGQNPLLLARHFLATISPLMKKGLEDCLRVCRGSDLIVCSAIGLFYAYHVAEKLDIPYVPAFLQPVHPTRHVPCMPFPQAPSIAGQNPKLSGGYNLLTYWAADKVLLLLRRATDRARREALDLPSMRGTNPVGAVVRERRPCLYAFSEEVLSRPPDWGDHLSVTGYWFLNRPEDWQPPEDLVDFLSSSPPPVSVGFGSMNEREPEKTTEVALDALRVSGKRGILLTGWGGLSNADLPDDVYKAEEIPHEWLFARVAAAVHHGGAGTTAASLRAAAPTVIVPFIGDQSLWGRLVHAIGAGPAPIPRKKLSTGRLAGAIGAAVGDRNMKSRSAVIARNIEAEDGVGSAVETLSLYLARNSSQ